MNLGGFASGLSSGLDTASMFMLRKAELEKQQFELEQQKRQQAATAAMFGQGRGVTGLPGAGGMPQPLPGMAGQPPGAIARAGNWIGNLFSGPQGGAGTPPAGNPAMGGVDAPPLPQPGTGGLPAPSGIGPWANGGGGMPQPVGNPGGGQGGGTDDFSFAGLDNHLQTIAQRIRQNNPGIDDQTLAEAVSQYVATMAKVGAISGPEQRYWSALLNNQTRRDVAGDTNQTRRDIAGDSNRTRRDLAGDANQTRRDIAGDRDATTRRGQDLGRQNTLDRIKEQKWSAELSSNWHIRGQDMTHDDRQASIEAGLERTRMVQDRINKDFEEGRLDKDHWQQAGMQVRALTAQMGTAQRIMNGIQNANLGADVSNNPQYQQASSQYETAAAKLDFIEQKLDEQGPVDKSQNGAKAPPKQPNPGPKQGDPAKNAAPVKVGDIVPGPDGKGKFKITRIDKDGTPHGVPVQ